MCDATLANCTGATAAATGATTPPWCLSLQLKPVMMQQTKNYGCLIVVDITTTTTEETS